MKRNVLSLLTATVLLGIATVSVADTAQEELQPKRPQFDRMEKFEGARDVPAPASGIGAMRDYRFLTDYNP